MAHAVIPTCFRDISLRLTPPRSISPSILRDGRVSVTVRSSSPNSTLNSYSSPKPYPHSSYRVRASTEKVFLAGHDCSGEYVSSSTGDDDHRQNDICNSCPDGMCTDMGTSPPSSSFTPVEDPNPIKSYLSSLPWRYPFELLKMDIKSSDRMILKSLHKDMLAAISFAALGVSTDAVFFIIAIAKCFGIILTLGDFRKAIDKVPFLADLKPSRKYVMEDVHKETIRPVDDPSGVVPGMNHSFILAGLRRKLMTYLEVVAGVRRRVMTYLAVVGGVQRRCTFHLLVDAGFLRRFRLEVVAGVRKKYIISLLVLAGVRRCEVRLEVNGGVRRWCLIHLLV